MYLLSKNFVNLFCSDDLLNYDIGDVIDDQVLIGADEDELLLSDDGEYNKCAISQTGDGYGNVT